MSEVIDFPTTPEWLRKYYERGFKLVFYPSKQKFPLDKGWEQRTYQASDYKDGNNVGILLGHEISEGKFLADIDFDWPDGVPLAKYLLPVTGFGFGRKSRILSHAFFTTPEPIASFKFVGMDNHPIVEIRGISSDGTLGLQTMAPPSVHPDGEDLVFRSDGDIGHSDKLRHHVAMYATACLLYANFKDRSFLHDARLATAGFLLTEGVTEEDVFLIGGAICEASGNNRKDFDLIVKTTVKRLKQGERVQGKSILVKLLGPSGKEIIARIKEWLGCSDFFEDAKGKVVPNHQENVKKGLEKIGIELSFDEFAQKPMVKVAAINGNVPYDGPLHDALVNQSWLEIDEKFHFRPDRSFFNSVVDNISNRNRYHPVMDYLRALTWDEEPRLDEWLIKSSGAADTKYVRAVSAIMLLAAVKRVIDPGCKYDEMVVLESMTQGLMKSTALRTICPNEKWFSDDLPLNVDAKQIVERTLGKWIIEASDLSGMRASAVEHLKGMLSRQTDGPVRLAYGRIPIEQPRQFIIVGTTNSGSYLTDSTGNRRFWPIRIKSFDIPWIRDNRDQIWAEAFRRASAGESIRLHPNLYAHAALQQERRRAEDPWETKLDETFGRDKRWRLTPDEVWAPLGIGIEKRDPGSNSRVLRVMEALGFSRKTVRSHDGRIVKGFTRDIEEGQTDIFHD